MKTHRKSRLAFDRTMRCCLDAGFQPTVVQEAPQFLTLIRLVAAGLGVSSAPHCVTTMLIPCAIYRPLRSKRWSSIDVGVRTGRPNAMAAVFIATVREHFGGLSTKAAAVTIRHLPSSA